MAEEDELNAHEPGTVMPIHRHMKSSETICMVRGKVVMRLFDDKGTITDEFAMAPAGSVTEPVEVLWYRLKLASGTRWKCWKKELWYLKRRMGSMSR